MKLLTIYTTQKFSNAITWRLTSQQVVEHMSGKKIFWQSNMRVTKKLSGHGQVTLMSLLIDHFIAIWFLSWFFRVNTKKLLTASEKSPKCRTSSTSVSSVVSSRDTTRLFFSSRTSPSSPAPITYFVGFAIWLDSAALTAFLVNSNALRPSALITADGSPRVFLYIQCKLMKILRMSAIIMLSFSFNFTSVCSDSTLSVSSVAINEERKKGRNLMSQNYYFRLVEFLLAVETIGPESSITLPSSNFTWRFTRVSICFVVVNSVLRLVIISSADVKNISCNDFIKFKSIQSFSLFVLVICEIF